MPVNLDLALAVVIIRAKLPQTVLLYLSAVERNLDRALLTRAYSGTCALPVTYSH